MLIQTSQKRYGEGFGLIFEFVWGKNKNCVCDIYIARTFRLHFNTGDKLLRLALGFLNLEITLGN